MPESKYIAVVVNFGEGVAGLLVLNSSARKTTELGCGAEGLEIEPSSLRAAVLLGADGSHLRSLIQEGIKSVQLVFIDDADHLEQWLIGDLLPGLIADYYGPSSDLGAQVVEMARDLVNAVLSGETMGSLEVVQENPWGYFFSQN